MANPAVEIANLKRQREKLFAERDQLVNEKDALIAKAGQQYRGGDTEGATALRAAAAQIETKLNSIEEQIGNLYTQITTLEQQQAEQDKASQPQTTVSNPAPPVEDPVEAKTAKIASTTDVQTIEGAATAGPNQPTKPADNKAPDDAETAIPEIIITAKRPTAAATATTKTPAVDAPIVPKPNVLDRFSNYTYQASVYLLTPIQFNKFQQSKKKSVSGYNLLFQSGGAGNNIGGAQGSAQPSFSTTKQNGADVVTAAAPGPDAGRNPFFPNDFYIDSITLENVPYGKGTMAAHGSTQLKFTVIEPANITLLDCMYKAVQDMKPADASGAVNYAAAVYLMAIRFYGYDEQGRIQKVGAASDTSSLTDPSAVVEKFIPFRIKNINWGVSSKLVTYEFECAPIGQIVAGGTRRGTVPDNYEVSGTTVGELLIGSVAPNNATATSGNRTDVNQTAAETNRLAAQNAAAAPMAPPKAAAAQQKGSNRAGLIGALNAAQQALVKQGIQAIADEFEIVFASGAEKIRDATLTKPGTTTNKGATDMGPAPSQNPSGMSPDKGAINANSRNQGITAGMQVMQAIELAIRNSNYITNQATTVISEDTEEGSTANSGSKATTFTWFNIAMSVTQLGYDKQRNDFAYKIRYTIIPNTPQDFKSEYFPIPKFRGVVKSYPFWFTGENSAVLDYQASFNKMYVQTITGSATKNPANEAAKTQFVSSMRDLPFVQYQSRSTESDQGAAGRANDLAANAAEYLYNPADNGKGTITIVGDPAWIQQGSAVGELDPNNINYDPFEADGTINFDTQDVLFEIVWQRPEDYDLGNGLADPYAKTQSSFGDRQPRQSVVYRMLNVISEFKQGRFQQQVTGALYRYPVKGDTSTATAASATQPGLDQSGRQTSAADARIAGRSNQTTATQLRTGVNLANTSAGAGRGVFGGATFSGLADFAASKASQTAAAALASKGGVLGPLLAPVASKAIDAAKSATGQFIASAPNAADTVTAAPPAKPVTSNGEEVSTATRSEALDIRAPDENGTQDIARDY